jgi:hypothetical protein
VVVNESETVGNGVSVLPHGKLRSSEKMLERIGKSEKGSVLHLRESLQGSHSVHETTSDDLP